MSADLVYWDTDPFLGWLQDEAAKVQLCQGTMERARAGEALIITSALTLTEVLWRKGGPRLAVDKADKLRRFFRHSYIRVVNVSRTIAEGAQDVVWNHDVRPKDAVHVATALAMKAAVLETFDDGLLKKSGLIGSPPLLIRTPLPPKQPRLDFHGG